MHEGLHAIGALHEHQHPDRTITFDENELLERLKGSDDPKKELNDSILSMIKRQKNGSTFTAYDQKLIMHYEFNSKELNGASAISKTMNYLKAISHYSGCGTLRAHFHLLNTRLSSYKLQR